MEDKIRIGRRGVQQRAVGEFAEAVVLQKGDGGSWELLLVLLLVLVLLNVKRRGGE